MGQLGQKYNRGIVIQRSEDGSAFQEVVDVDIDSTETSLESNLPSGIKKVNISAVGGTEVEANPELEGDEDALTGIEIDGTKYKVDGGTEVEANPTLVGTEANLTGLQVGDTKYKVGGNSGQEIRLADLFDHTNDPYYEIKTGSDDVDYYIQINEDKFAHYFSQGGYFTLTESDSGMYDVQHMYAFLSYADGSPFLSAKLKVMGGLAETVWAVGEIHLPMIFGNYQDNFNIYSTDDPHYDAVFSEYGQGLTFKTVLPCMKQFVAECSFADLVENQQYSYQEQFDLAYEGFEGDPVFSDSHNSNYWSNTDLTLSFNTYLQKIIDPHLHVQGMNASGQYTNMTFTLTLNQLKEIFDGSFVKQNLYTLTSDAS